MDGLGRADVRANLIYIESIYLHLLYHSEEDFKTTDGEKMTTVKRRDEIYFSIVRTCASSCTEQSRQADQFLPLLRHRFYNTFENYISPDQNPHPI